MTFKKNIDISFELFPPQLVNNNFDRLKIVCQSLLRFNPKYFSVTFGASGSSQTNTLKLVNHLVENKITTTPHISCVNMTKERLEKLLAQYLCLGIKQLVVIQGDLLENDTVSKYSDFKYAYELVEFIRRLTNNTFTISVAAYPEYHPRAHNSDTDLTNLKRKIDAGADNAITQFFYNTDAYVNFIDRCHQFGITVPIIPGIMPIHNYKKLLKFTASCGAEFPLWLRKLLHTHEKDDNAIKEIGIKIVTQLCEALLRNGATDLHFYTLNQAEPTANILKNLCLGVIK